jgi:hypothetical protein
MTQAMTTSQQRWAALGYQQVPGLANRLISRYLRTQRRNLTRFFVERGMIDLAERMRQIKHSRQGMLAKNQMFQKVMSDYAERVTPRAKTEPTTEATHLETEGCNLLGVPPSGGSTEPSGDRPDAGSSVPELDSGAGVVIEE